MVEKDLSQNKDRLRQVAEERASAASIIKTRFFRSATLTEARLRSSISLTTSGSKLLLLLQMGEPLRATLKPILLLSAWSLLCLQQM